MTDSDNTHTNNNCWICKSSSVRKIVSGNITELDNTSMQVTDARYGYTLTRVQCNDCGFQFCPEIGDPTEIYSAMVDEEYEKTRKPRAVQALKLVNYFKKNNCQGKLLDIGAGSGILVEQAANEGFDAHGIEPSKWLADVANKLGLKVQCGTLPHNDIPDQFETISCIDVIEHVNDPLQLLHQVQSYLAPEGKAFIVTPDAQSFAAKLMGKKWWHYRTAHIGYFDKATLEKAVVLSGLHVVKMTRPTWFFTVSYLWERLAVYIPLLSKIKIPDSLGNLTVPLNLFDSWLILVEKKARGSHGE